MNPSSWIVSQASKTKFYDVTKRRLENRNNTPNGNEICVFPTKGVLPTP